jgi:hypothetical protein
MALDKNTLTGAILLVALYIFVTQPLTTSFATAGISVLLFAVLRSEGVVLGFMLASLFIRDLNKLFIPRPFEPVGVEAFQVRDAPSVHTRIESVKQDAPLAPKVQEITGVLESPNILDNSPLLAMDTLAKEGVPGASIPASSKARVRIPTPAEGFSNSPNESVDRPPMENPPLQNGPDTDAVDTSLVEYGATMDGAEDVTPSDMAAM